MSGCQDFALMHLHHDLEIHVDKVHGKGPRNYNVHRHCWEGVWGCGGKQFGTKTWQNDRKRYFYFRKQAFLDMDRCERDEIMKACASLVTEI